MRLFLALWFLASTLSATTFFDPPNPTSATSVVAHVTIPPPSCYVEHVDVVRSAHAITITVWFPLCPASPPATAPFDFPVTLGVVPAGVYDVVAVLGNPAFPPNPVLDRGTLVVQDGAPPFEVVPNVLPLNGGEIRLRNGVGFGGCVGSPPICQTVTVKIDGQPATPLPTPRPSLDLVVLAPPHAPGVVDVTVERFFGQTVSTTATAALDYFEFGKVPEPAFFEPVLFPALVTGAGAYGSQWVTDAALRNDNDLPLPVTSSAFNVLCFPVCDTRPQPHGTITMHDNAPGGFVFYAARQFAPRLFFDVLARDLSRQSEALGTEIPVAREKDLYDRPFEILLVPTDPKYRVALRLFRTDGMPAVNVNVFSMNGETRLASGQFQLAANTPDPRYMSLMIPDLVARFPELAGKGPLRIAIGEPSSRSTWALVSVTNNDTQHVTVLAPH